MSTSGQEPSICNLSDDQKLVMSVSDSESTCKISKTNMKVSAGSSQKSDVIIFRHRESPQSPPMPPKVNIVNRPKQNILSESFCSDSSSTSSDSVHTNDKLVAPNLTKSNIHHNSSKKNGNFEPLPPSLLIDIRNYQLIDEQEDEHESNCSDSEICNPNSIDGNLVINIFNDDNFYKYHINENLSYDAFKMTHDESDESYAGLKNLKSGSSTIRSKNGTIRGIKNRVRSGISTFLQMQQTTVKVNYAEEERMLI